jgi:D-amino-acid dehydrogenase
MKHCIIIGGGIIGLSSAYYLQKEGHQVTVIDQSDFSSGASYVNAGYISPSHIVSLAAPGMISKGIKWMFNPASPFYVKPRLETDFLKWALAFKKSATASKVEKSMPVIKDITVFSRQLFEEMHASKEFDFFYEHKGLMMYYKTDKAGEEEWNVGKKAIELGLKVENLSKEGVQKIEKNIDVNVKGAVYYHSDAHMTPNQFMLQLKKYLEKNGVVIHSNKIVEDVVFSGDKISAIRVNQEDFTADEFVFATGSWTQNFVKKLGLNISIQAGKGYRINVERPTNISIPGILMEAKVAVTPMNGFTRFAGTMEIGGINHHINPVRVKAIANAAENYYAGLKINSQEIENAQCGLRPCSPDGLPYIGKSAKFKNATFATGHAMMGWSLGPATGKLVAEIISDKKTSLEVSPFHVDRKF